MLEPHTSRSTHSLLCFLSLRCQVSLLCPPCPCHPCLLVWACSRLWPWCLGGLPHLASTWAWSPQVCLLLACHRMISWRWFSRGQPWCCSRRREPSSRWGRLDNVIHFLNVALILKQKMQSICKIKEKQHLKNNTFKNNIYYMFIKEWRTKQIIVSCEILFV